MAIAEIEVLRGLIERHSSQNLDSDERDRSLAHLEGEIEELLELVRRFREEPPSTVSTSRMTPEGGATMITPELVAKLGPPPAFRVWKSFGEEGGPWEGVHLYFKFPLPWEWKGVDSGWVPIRGMVSPWWGETAEVTVEVAQEFIAHSEGLPTTSVSVARVSENYSGELEERGLSDDVLDAVGFRRMGTWPR